MKIAQGIFDAIVRIAQGFGIEGDEDFIENDANGQNENEKMLEEELSFQVENEIEGLSGTLKLTQNPKKILKGVIIRAVDPDYGTRTGKSARHLLQTVLMFKVPVFRKFFVEELQGYVVRQLHPWSLEESNLQQSSPSSSKTKGHLPSQFCCVKEQVILLSPASWGLMRDLVSDCLREASDQDDFEVMGWLLHLSGFYAKQCGLFMHSITESLRGNEHLQRPELWLTIFDRLASFEEKFWQGPERSTKKVFGLNVKQATDLAIVLRMRSLAGAMRRLGLRLDLNADEDALQNLTISPIGDHSGSGTLSPIEDEVVDGEVQEILLPADDGGWWGDQFWAGCASRVGEQNLELEDCPLRPEAASWVLGLLAGHRLAAVASYKPVAISKQELWAGRHCQTLGFCPLLEILRTVVTAHSMTGGSPPPEMIITSDEKYLQCACGRRFLPWKVLGSFDEVVDMPKSEAPGKNNKVIGERVCEHCFRMVCRGWPKGTDPLMPILFCMGSAIFPSVPPERPKGVSDFFEPQRVYEEKPRIHTLQKFIKMLKKGIDVTKVEDEKASLFAWAKPKGRTLFIDRRGRRLCWVLKGRQKLEPEQNKSVALSSIERTEAMQESSPGVFQFLLHCKKRCFIIETEDEEIRDLLISGLDCLVKNLQKTGGTDVSKI